MADAKTFFVGNVADVPKRLYRRYLEVSEAAGLGTMDLSKLRIRRINT